MIDARDAAGARVWQRIEAGKSLAAVCDAMIGEYDVARAVLEQDVFNLVGELKTKGLIRVAQAE